MTAQSNIETLVTVFGGSGFLGRHVVRALAKRGYRIRVAVRRPDLAGQLDRAAEQEELLGQRRLAGIGVRDDRERPAPRDFALELAAGRLVGARLEAGIRE